MQRRRIDVPTSLFKCAAIDIVAAMHHILSNVLLPSPIFERSRDLYRDGDIGRPRRAFAIPWCVCHHGGVSGIRKTGCKVLQTLSARSAVPTPKPISNLVVSMVKLCVVALNDLAGSLLRLFRCRLRDLGNGLSCRERASQEEHGCEERKEFHGK